MWIFQNRMIFRIWKIEVNRKIGFYFPIMAYFPEEESGGLLENLDIVGTKRMMPLQETTPPRAQHQYGHLGCDLFS